MFKKINHVGIAVKDLNRFIDIFAGKLDFKLGKVEEVKKEEVEYRIAFFPIGESDIEFVQSSEERGIIADYIRERGEGMHHIALEVEQIEKMVNQLKAQGMQFLWDISEGAKGSKVAFIDPRETGGILIELVQSKNG